MIKKSFKSYITEWSYTDPGVNQYMRRKGYKKLGKGVDQTAWLSSTGEIIKIFGASTDNKLDHFSKDHEMFVAWFNYCEKNSSNIFLPKYFGWETFSYSERTYLQIKTERLQHLDKNVGDALENIIAYYGVHDNNKNRKINLSNIKVFSKETIGQSKLDREGGLSQLIILLGEDNFDLLYKTIGEIANIGRKNNWGIDLHADNFMQRSDGAPVIADPWVAL